MLLCRRLICPSVLLATETSGGVEKSHESVRKPCGFRANQHQHKHCFPNSILSSTGHTYRSITVISGATNTAALAAEAQSAPSRRPRFLVFHLASLPDSSLDTGTAGMCICGPGILIAGESFDIVVEDLCLILGSRGSCCCCGIEVVEVPGGGALKPAGEGLLLVLSC